jgi:hypothetical protein
MRIAITVAVCLNFVGNKLAVSDYKRARPMITYVEGNRAAPRFAIIAI